MRYMLIVIAFLVAVIGWYMFKDLRSKNTIEALTTENNALKSNNSFLEKRIEKEHQDTMAISLRNKELEKEAAKDKAYFDWHADISNTAVIKRLQAN